MDALLPSTSDSTTEPDVRFPVKVPSSTSRIAKVPIRSQTSLRRSRRGPVSLRHSLLRARRDLVARLDGSPLHLQSRPRLHPRHFHARLTRNANAPVLGPALVQMAFVAGSQSAQYTIVPFTEDLSEVNATVATWRLPFRTISPVFLIRMRS